PLLELDVNPADLGALAGPHRAWHRRAAGLRDVFEKNSSTVVSSGPVLETVHSRRDRPWSRDQHTCRSPNIRSETRPSWIFAGDFLVQTRQNNLARPSAASPAPVGGGLSSTLPTCHRSTRRVLAL